MSKYSITLLLHVVTHKGLDLSKHVVPVIPYTVESQHLPVHLQELLQLVPVGLCLEDVLGVSSGQSVRVCRSVRWTA